MKFTVAVPTYQRPDSLAKTLDSILSNTRLPNEVLIIDDDVLDPLYIENYQERGNTLGVDILYCKKDHAVRRQGLSESKNWAMELANFEILFYLDDDVVLEETYFNEIMKTWEQHQTDDQLFAVGGKISNNRSQSGFEMWYYRLFGLTGEYDWDVNRLGFQCWNESVTQTQWAHYIHGGVSSYRVDLLKEFGFVEFSGGRTSLEDVELGMRCKNAGYHFYYVPSARLAHHHESSGREDRVLSGEKESRNRREIFRLHAKKSRINRLRFFWANIGWILKKCLTGNFPHAFGMIRGLFL